MRTEQGLRITAVQIALIVFVLLPAALCGCAIRHAGVDSSVRGSRDPTEESIVQFMLDDVIRKWADVSIRAAPQRDSDGPGASKPLCIIVWCHVEPVRNQLGWTRFEAGEPIRVWLYDRVGLMEKRNKIEAIRGYRRKYVEPNFGTGFPGWCYFKFGIVSISADKREAEVYYEFTCGSLCGRGVLYTLVFGNQGTWERRDASELWRS